MILVLYFHWGEDLFQSWGKIAWQSSFKITFSRFVGDFFVLVK